jgi:hypothetical protein
VQAVSAMLGTEMSQNHVTPESFASLAKGHGYCSDFAWAESPLLSRFTPQIPPTSREPLGTAGLEKNGSKHTFLSQRISNFPPGSGSAFSPVKSVARCLQSV